MSEKTEIAVSVMPKLEDKIVDLSSRLEQIMQERAPEAWEAVLAVVRVDAARDIFLGCGLIAVIYGLLRLFGYCRKRHSEARYELWDLAGGFSLVVAAVSAVVAFLTLANAWTWVALFSPELVIAKRIMAGLL